MLKFISLFSVLFLTACNSVYIKPNTMEPNSTVYASRGGNTMTRGIKEKLEEHGFTVNVGNLKDESSIDVDKFSVPKNTKYVVRVSERRKLLCHIGACLTGFGGGDLMFQSRIKRPVKKSFLGAGAVAKTVHCANLTDSWMN